MTLTSRQRVLNALHRKDVDIAPVANPNSIVTREMQDLVGAFFPEAHHNAEAMTQLALAGRTVCGYDAVFPVFGAGTQEAGAMGIDIDWGDPDNLPAILGHIWDHPDQIHVPDDFLDRLEISTVLDSIRMLRQEVGDEVAVIGKAYGPWSLAYHFFGIEPFLMDTHQDPPKVHAILEGLKAFTVIFGKAQIEAGADALNVCEHITADLIRPEAYSTYLQKIDQDIARQLSVPVILHCCGKTMDRIDLFNDSGYACFNFESANDAFEMRAKATVSLCGNINNPRTLLQGTPEDVTREVFYALDAGVEILAPECAAPVNGKLANVTAVREARDKYYDNATRDQARTFSIPDAGAKPIRPRAEAADTPKADTLSESLREIYDAVLHMKKGVVAPLVEQEVAKGTDVQVILDDALIAAMEEVGNLFADGTYFVPEMLMAANEMKSGLEVIRPILTETGVPPKGKVLLGTVKGDVHDIGKNLYGMMMEGAGFTIIDIGVRNSADDFIVAMEEHKPDIVGMSAMLTTTMPYMKVIIDELQSRGMRDDYIVLVGGAPLTDDFGSWVGADAYCEDAGRGIETSNRLLAERGETPAEVIAKAG
jgi:[methyl-Co(III) methanol-specific corrinoid protein]:coenzyme M methyltransferase